MPDAAGIEIPEIDVVGDELSENDGEVVSQPAVDHEQIGAADAEHPEEGWRDDFFRPFRLDPLMEHAQGEEALGEQAHTGGQQIFLHASILEKRPVLLGGRSGATVGAAGVSRLRHGGQGVRGRGGISPSGGFRRPPCR